MIKKIDKLPLIFFLALLAFPLSAENADWNRAVSFYEGSENWRAGTMSMISRELDRRGGLKEEWELEYRLKEGGGTDEWEVVSAIKDGEPPTERELEKRQNSSGPGGDDGGQSPPDDYFEGVDVLPLARSEISRVDARNTGKTEWFEGERLAVYSFTHSYEGGAETKGTLLLSSEGFPRKLEYEFTNLPFYMKTMKCLFTFSRQADDAVVESMRMEGHVSAVVFNMHFINIMNFGGYFRGDA